MAFDDNGTLYVSDAGGSLMYLKTTVLLRSITE